MSDSTEGASFELSHSNNDVLENGLETLDIAPAASPPNEPTTEDKVIDSTKEENNTRGRLNAEKQQDIELSAIMRGRKLKYDIDESGAKRAATDSNGNPLEEADPELAGLSAEQLRVMVIDKKIDFLLDEAKRIFGNDQKLFKNASETITALYKNQREKLVNEITEKKKTQLDKGSSKSIDDPEVKKEINDEVDQILREREFKFRRGSLEKVLDNVGHAGEAVDSIVDVETLFALFTGESVRQGRYSSMSKNEASEHELDIDDIKYSKNKARHFKAAFQMVGLPVMDNYTEEDSPHNEEIVGVLEKEVYPNGRKSLIFMKTLLVSYGKDVSALSESQAQEMVLKLAKEYFGDHAS